MKKFEKNDIFNENIQKVFILIFPYFIYKLTKNVKD